MEYINCNLCSGNEAELLFLATDNQFHLNGQFNVVKCKRCGLIYVNPRPTREEIKFYYPEEKYYSYQEPVNKKGLDQRIKSLIRQSLAGYNKNSVIKRLIGRVIEAIVLRQIDIIVPFKENGRILDVGCGNGEMIGWMRKYGWKTYGVEINEKACKQSEKQGLNVFCGELQDADFPSKFFDVITINHVLEHVHDPLALLKECNQILKKDGLLIVDCPNFGCLDSKLFGKDWSVLQVPTHLYHFTRDTLNKILNVAGFQLNKWRFKFPFPLYDRLSIKIFKENNKNIPFRCMLKVILEASLVKLIRYIFSRNRGVKFSVNITAYASKSI